MCQLTCAACAPLLDGQRKAVQSQVDIIVCLYDVLHIKQGGGHAEEGQGLVGQAHVGFLQGGQEIVGIRLTRASYERRASCWSAVTRPPARDDMG